MNLEKLHSVFLVGIGGIGMSALARWFVKKGIRVAGYDRISTGLTRKLLDEGISIIFKDDVRSIPPDFHDPDEDILIIYTPAIPSENNILGYFKENHFVIRKRSEVLGEITEEYFTIAVAGTHGKTTTTSLIAHILKESGKSLIAFLGGIMVNYDSNLVINNASEEESPIVVVEADEYDRSFLKLNPDLGIVTAIDADHLDVYGSEAEMQEAYGKFIERIRQDGILILKKGTSGILHTIQRNDLQVIEYALEHNPVRSDDLRTEKEETRFTYVSPEITIENIPLAMPGFHNVENAIAAITASLCMNINEQVIKSALSTFRGIKRRFEYIYYSEEVIFIDDYAHHPEEIRALLSSVKAIFPDRKLTAIFQPHLFSRTRDFAAGFARSLELADEIILLEIYPAREKPVRGISSKIIFDKIRNSVKKMVPKTRLLDQLRTMDLELVLTIGAGDIDLLIDPIKKYLESRHEISE